MSMLRYARLDTKAYPKRTYLISSGDSFSARKAVEFENQLEEQNSFDHSNVQQVRGISNIQTNNIKKDNIKTDNKESKILKDEQYTILTVPRARKIHQSFLTAPLSTLQCFRSCLLALLGTHPDQKITKLVVNGQSPEDLSAYPNIILTNGPGTGVCVVVAARLLRIVDSLMAMLLRKEKYSESQGGGTQIYLRTVFIESWARVTTLSLSGKILLPLVDRFLVQWGSLSGYSGLFGGKAEYVGILLS